MAIRVDFVSGRELKVGSVYLPKGQKGFYKVSDVQTSKPGKHGSAKNNVTCKHILTSKSYTTTYLDSSEKVPMVLDFDYIHDVIYDFGEAEFTIDIETNRILPFDAFGNDDKEKILSMRNELKMKENNGLQNEQGHPLVVKYSEVPEGLIGEYGAKLIFWDLIYVNPNDFQKCGIKGYIGI